MINLYSKLFLKSNIFISIIIFFFSFSINYYYSNLGVFPIDTFFHYDGAARILKSEIPVRDFWVVSGLVIDFLQSLFFKIFGINWNSYIIHSSILNFIVSILIYYYFLNLRINKVESLFFTCCFATLAYTISGTPFVDHHATFFLLISTILLINVINSEKKFIWFFIILFFFLSFLTKQVPAGYILIIQGPLIFFYIIYEKKYSFLKHIVFSVILIVLIFTLFLTYFKIDLKTFYIQYFDYPRSIGSSRFENFNTTINNFFNNFKFIIIPFVFIIFLKLKKIRKNSLKLYTRETYGSLIFFSFLISILIHQLMTKNQIFIYFLVPILFGILYSEIKLLSLKNKSYLSYILIISLFLITYKYHDRYNENRKFHELEGVNFTNAISASEIDPSLKGLLWINPFFKGDPQDEITLIKEAILNLNNQEDEIMLITHYLFLDSVTNNDLNYPNRSFTTDGASMPVNGNKYFTFYQEFLIDKIKNKQIKKIMFFKHEEISEKTITDYIDQSCYNRSEDEIFYIYQIKCFN